MIEHMEGKGQFHFMGTHPLELFADVNWNEDGKTGTVTGVGKMKMLKWLTYQFSDNASAEKLDNGDMHFECGLKSQFGNGELACILDLTKDGDITGYCAIIKGVKLNFEAKRVV